MSQTTTENKTTTNENKTTTTTENKTTTTNENKTKNTKTPNKQNGQKVVSNTKNGNYKRIKIEHLPRNITRDHVEELCSKFGRVNEIEMRRTPNEMISFVSFFNYVDAEYALYRLTDYPYSGVQLEVSAAELTEEEIKERQELAKERERKRMEGREKKKKVVKPPKGSLRHLAPRNVPTNDGQTNQGYEHKVNVQENRKQGGNQGQRKPQNGQGFRGNQNQGQGRKQGGNQGQKRTNNNQNQGQKGGNVVRNQGNNEQNRNNNQQFKKKYQVKNSPQTEHKTTEPSNDNNNDNNEIFEVIVKNTQTGKQILYTNVSQETLDALPSELRSKIDYDN